jgi:hypothetical protein
MSQGSEEQLNHLNRSAQFFPLTVQFASNRPADGRAARLSRCASGRKQKRSEKGKHVTFVCSARRFRLHPHLAPGTLETEARKGLAEASPFAFRLSASTLFDNLSQPSALADQRPRSRSPGQNRVIPAGYYPPGLAESGICFASKFFVDDRIARDAENRAWRLPTGDWPLAPRIPRR